MDREHRDLVARAVHRVAVEVDDAVPTATGDGQIREALGAIIVDVHEVVALRRSPARASLAALHRLAVIRRGRMIAGGVIELVDEIPSGHIDRLASSRGLVLVLALKKGLSDIGRF